MWVEIDPPDHVTCVHCKGTGRRKVRKVPRSMVGERWETCSNCSGRGYTLKSIVEVTQKEEYLEVYRYARDGREGKILRS